MRGYGVILQCSFILVILLQFRLANRISFPIQHSESEHIKSNSEMNASNSRHDLNSDSESNDSCSNWTSASPSWRKQIALNKQLQQLHQTTSDEMRHTQIHTYRSAVKRLPYKETLNKILLHSRNMLNGMRTAEDGGLSHKSKDHFIASAPLYQGFIQFLLVPRSQDRLADNVASTPSTRQITTRNPIQAGDIINNQVLLKEDDKPTSDYSQNSWQGRRILSDDDNDNKTDFDIDRITTAAVTQCPYADFCFTRSSITAQPGTVSCCKPCHCDSDCSRRMDCCFQSVDQTNIVKTNKMSCLSSRLAYSEHDAESYPSYYMVDKCLSNDTISCSDAALGSRRSFYPVYSNSADLIFVNRECAECNGVYDSTNWTVYLSCKEDASVLDSIFLEEVTRGVCAMVFVPPADAYLDKYICYNELFDSCNMTGNWDQYDKDIELACETVRAPIEAYGKQFGNVFCKLCNGFRHRPMTMCEPKVWLNMITRSESGNLFALLDYKLYSNIATKEQDGKSTQEKPSETEKCGEFEVMHPITRECRTVFCPHSSVRTKKGCELFISRWQAPGYKIHVALTPVGKELIELSAFTRLTKKQVRNCNLWIDSSGIPLEHFMFHVKTLKRNNVSYAYHLDLETGSKNGPVETKRTLDLVRSALSKPWKIRLDKTTYLYRARFDRLKILDPTKDFVKYADYIRSRESDSENRMVWFEDLFRFHEGHLFINKLHYCEQVQLYQGEWTAKPLKQGTATIEMEIKLNLTGSNDEKILGNGEYNIIRSRIDDDSKKVRICVEDFYEQFVHNYGFDRNLISKPTEFVIIYFVFVNLFL